VRRQRDVHDRVDPRARDDLRDQGVADVGADELHPAHPAPQIRDGRHGVDAQHPFDRRVGGQARREVAAKEAAHSGDEHDRGRHGTCLKVRATSRL
jgi:hypothetical protein